MVPFGNWNLALSFLQITQQKRNTKQNRILQTLSSISFNLLMNKKNELTWSPKRFLYRFINREARWNVFN